MKKTLILAAALGLALLCLVRLDLVAKEAAEKDAAKTAARSKPAEGRPQGPRTAPASLDALRYMPDGCRGHCLGRRGRTGQSRPSLDE